jgi:S-DNA-T family DNA segregation ATPase FtsK/SpoIIIE
MTAISMSRALREGALWVLGALALILLAALVTYDPGDPGYTDTGAGGSVSNAIGPVGAWVSNLFYFLFGKPSFLFPLMLAYMGWMVIRPRRDEPLTRTTLLLRGGGFVLTLASSAALATLHFSSGRLPGAPAASWAPHWASVSRMR